MATVSRGSDESTDKKKVEYIDPFSTEIEPLETRKLNPDANPDDAWGSSAPPPKGFYKLRIMPLAKDSVQKKMSRNDDPYYSANVEFQIVSDDKDVDGNSVYGTVTTIVGRGKDISTMAALIKKAGFQPLPKGSDEITDGDLVRKLGALSKKMPVLKEEVMVNWQGAYQSKDGSWENVLRDWDDFPVDTDGAKLHEVTVVTPEGRKSITARANIQWNAKKDDVKPTKAPTPIKASATASTKASPAMTPNVDDLDSL